MNHELDLSTLPTDVSASFDRRGLFRIGGLTVAAAALVAACSDNTIAGPVGRVGVGEPNPTLKDPVINDGVLLRTSASIELSIVGAYNHIIEKGWLAKSSTTLPKLGDQTALVKEFITHHQKAAEMFNSLAQEAGAEPWTCGNPRLDSAFLDIIFERVENGAKATDNAKAIPPSDDPTRDMINLVFTLENVSAATCQALVPQVTQPSFRAESMRIGARSARQGSLTSLKINPGVYVSAVDAQAAQPGVTTTAAPVVSAPPATNPDGSAKPPLTEIPLPVAVPSPFGSLSGLTWVGADGDENGVRLKLIFETPSLNSLTYPFMSCGGQDGAATTTTG
jgi:hypothetical protein